MNTLDNVGVARLWNHVVARLNDFVLKEDGKGLSTEDYTTEEKTKLSGIESGANKTIIDDILSSTSKNPIQNKVINAEINNINDKKINLPETDGTVNYGTAGQFAVSDGAGGITWQTINNGDEVNY